MSYPDLDYEGIENIRWDPGTEEIVLTVDGKMTKVGREGLALGGENFSWKDNTPEPLTVPSSVVEVQDEMF